MLRTAEDVTRVMGNMKGVSMKLGQIMSLMGGESGTPVIAVTGAGPEPVVFFGPVISQVPDGEQAGRLWDGTLLVAGTPHFHELKGPSREKPRTP